MHFRVKGYFFPLVLRSRLDIRVFLPVVDDPLAIPFPAPPSFFFAGPLIDGGPFLPPNRLLSPSGPFSLLPAFTFLPPIFHPFVAPFSFPVFCLQDHVIPLPPSSD